MDDSSLSDAIARSIRHDTVTRLDYTPEREADLLSRADDYADNGPEFEFWGTDADGDAWRVHLVREQPMPDFDRP